MSKNTTLDIVNKLWSLCNLLKDDGVTYHQYVSELTYLLFLKMADETNTEEGIPESYRWNQLEILEGIEQFDHYKLLLLKLGTAASGSSLLVQEIYVNASTCISKAKTLSQLVKDIDELDWYNAKVEGLGDLYEGLLQKNAEEGKKGAGQYFTPRVLIDSIISVMQPKLDDIIQDPAAGTGGFLIAARQWINNKYDISLLNEAQQKRLYQKTFYGMEHVKDTHRLALMNLMLHGLESSSNGGGIQYGDTLTSKGEKLPKASLIITNPPFGTKKGGGLPSRNDFTFPTPNKQLCFLQHIYRGLDHGGRAAVVLPDNVLYEGNVGKQIREDLMSKCDLHTILRLPTGIFYAQGVQTNVLFFTRGEGEQGNTKKVWIYDLRTNMPNFGKRNPLNRSHFKEFEEFYGSDPYGKNERIETGPKGRYKCFNYNDLSKNNFNLDLTWLQDQSEKDTHDLPDPAVLAQNALENMEDALEEIKNIIRSLA
ncbi:N-6 DNA methylase [Prochlorococcus marinus]|uniref:class I SAM-dependent DNA methyltransferase n=1 Tax=Prochlorococcus marinus TaxID=1219 RepID=UPI0039B069AD